MKNIKISDNNKLSIEAALLKTNEGATGHTLTAYRELERVVADVENDVVQLVGSKKTAVGARAIFTSGDRVPISYSYKRRATEVAIERRSAGWYLIDIKRVEVSIGGGGEPRLFLTSDQDRVAVARVRSAYTTVQSETSQEA